MNARDLRIDADAAVRAVAAAVGLRARTDLARALTEHAVERVAGWLQECGVAPTSLDDVHALVLNRVGLRVERVASQADLDRVAAAYRRELPAAGAQLELEFGQDTEAIVFRRPTRDPRTAAFVAFVDARGDRARRAWFSERHEPGHLILPDPSGQAVVRRTEVDRPEPLEQVVDSVAAAVGFWTPVVQPVLREALVVEPDLLSAFASARSMLAPGASQEAAFRAFSALLDVPALVIGSYFGTRADGSPDSAAVRARVVIRNAGAQAAGLFVPDNYRIPVHSAIHAAFGDRRRATYADHDDLGRWSDRHGRRLAARAVRVVARGSWAILVPR